MSNVLEFEARVTVERQAREWLIRLDGDRPLTKAEHEELRQWMDHHPSHREELKRIASFWHQANVLTELAVPLNQVAERHTISRTRKAPLLLAVVCALLTVMALGIWRLQHSYDAVNGVYSTAIGQQQTITLTDGSVIRLNTNSRLQVDYSETSRNIRLLHGEALFSVTRNLKSPFDVYAADTMVRAVGTAFSIHVAGSEVAVTVTKGTVDVAQFATGPDTGAANAFESERATRRLGTLKAGQTTTLRASTASINVQQLPEPELARRMAWQEGYLEFSGESLSEVVAQVNRYSQVQLEIADPKLASIAVGGRFRIGDLDAVLDVLRANFGIQSVRVDAHNINLKSAYPP
jgi:transmembrane sensor